MASNNRKGRRMLNIAAGIVNRYFSAFVTLQTKLKSLQEETA